MTISQRTSGHAAPVIIPAAGLPAEVVKVGVERASDLALSTGKSAVLIGQTGDFLAVCNDFDCCGSTPGALVVVPDVALAELAANGHDLGTANQWRLQRQDGRSVSVFRVPGAGGSP